MRTIALRFSDNFAPANGTIKLHQECINKKGFVWYGKLGSPVSMSVGEQVLKNDKPRILLIQSGKSARYWAYIDRISKEVPEKENIPEYYRDQANLIKTWFRVIKFETAEKNVMAKCIVASSKALLSSTSRHSMSPYFIIDYYEDEHDAE